MSKNYENKRKSDKNFRIIWVQASNTKRYATKKTVQKNLNRDKLMGKRSPNG